MTCNAEQGIRLHVDRKVLRDILQARIAEGKRGSFYTVGSVFTGMGFTLVAMGSTNYTASTLFVLIGLFVYMCIGGVNVDYDEGGAYADVDADEWKEPARCPSYDYEEEAEDGEDGEDGEESDAEADMEYKELSVLTKAEKSLIFRGLFHELCGFHIGEQEMERIFRPRTRTRSEPEPEPDVEVETVEPETPPNSDAGLTIIEEASSEEEQPAPRLARAETSYSAPEELVEADVQATTQATVQPIIVPEEVNNSDITNNGPATPESSTATA
jgi:hypothetical protein